MDTDKRMAGNKRLRDEFEAFEVGFGPLRLLFDHAAESFWHECCVGAVEGNRHPATVRMLVAAMAATFALAPCETIGEEGAYYFGGR